MTQKYSLSNAFGSKDKTFKLHVTKRRDTWKPKHMVGIALKTAVQEEALKQTQQFSSSSKA